MNPDHLIVIARDLVQRDSGKPQQAPLKRAVSTAYYALFHALAHECIAQTTTWNFRSPRYWEIVTPIYRAMDHGAAKALFNRLLSDTLAPTQLKQIARTFIELQAERISADYNPKPSFTRRNADLLVTQAENAVVLLRGLPNDTKRELAVLLVTRQR